MNEWDDAADTFDDAPDHGLRDPLVRKAWADLLRAVTPEPPATVVDLGCGTGSLSVLLSAMGHRVHGLDLSERMLAVAARKAGAAVALRQGDASAPPYPPATFDVVLARHVLWALDDPATAVRRWVDLLRAGGRLVLVEGHWHTGAGLTALECRDLVLAHRHEAEVRRLDDPALWGGAISDERYLVLSTR
ncbi:class I SAM-dependent methyltransferase [Actinokineospora diospyrosa]|uniref:Methyltransferase domain-containing protein n=1 Tax=Actinokineospora diospyrosa TaxID=103728 RepID=A0ABT1IJB1_9PSEU|nr:class I SAM-dependent methyltransferase [Actinokineospora diospyrosa]MCP2272738.1 Methyltransferase domain-containing protein [Actinokineospora diospyrosa]